VYFQAMNRGKETKIKLGTSATRAELMVKERFEFLSFFLEILGTG
jgi:hypothetical protein